jgi:hypothetical protein
MVAILALLLIFVLFGVGFAAKALFYVAAAVLVLWLLGFVAHGTERRWYYW